MFHDLREREEYRERRRVFSAPASFCRESNNCMRAIELCRTVPSSRHSNDASLHFSTEEDTMSDGGIGDPGLSYCATIRISGDLEQKDLQDVIDRIKKILEDPKVNGKIESHARVSTAATFDGRALQLPKPKP
jgi:hypothetical protein